MNVTKRTSVHYTANFRPTLRQLALVIHVRRHVGGHIRYLCWQVLHAVALSPPSVDQHQREYDARSHMLPCGTHDPTTL
jgi:hypothetical protein